MASQGMQANKSNQFKAAIIGLIPFIPFGVAPGLDESAFLFVRSNLTARYADCKIVGLVALVDPPRSRLASIVALYMRRAVAKLLV